jgi:hypothetical protein
MQSFVYVLCTVRYTVTEILKILHVTRVTFSDYSGESCFDYSSVAESVPNLVMSEWSDSVTFSELKIQLCDL